MEIIKCWEESGEIISEPYHREIKVLLAPDRRDCPEITYSHVIIHSHSKTDYHKHDRPELIHILSGRGVSICDGKETPVEPDMVLWVRAGEAHQMINKGEESMKIATVFIPGYTAEKILSTIHEAAKKDKKNIYK